MPRRQMTERDRYLYSNDVLSQITQAQYVHPGGYTNSHLFLVDATTRFIAVPPVMNTIGPMIGSTSERQIRPTSFAVYRANDYYLAMDGPADSRYAAQLPGGFKDVYPLNPAVNTLSFAAVTGTDQLYLTWHHGS